MKDEVGIEIPEKGHWPVDPQDDVPVAEDRIWIDGCFDFFHHGHANVMRQARQFGTELLVGLHSDEDILSNKGPTVMNLAERVSAVDACRWTTGVVPHAPYVTSIPWISHYGCKYVVHGDDITSDSDGNDCYRFVKKAGRFKVVKRTQGISTTDLVGRMLLCTKAHFIKSLEKVLDGQEGPGDETQRKKTGEDMLAKMKDYASDESATKPGAEVWSWRGDGAGSFKKLVAGKSPKPGQRIVYVDGGFDLFNPGHIEFLRLVCENEEADAKERGWYDEEWVQHRKNSVGYDYPPMYVVAGVHDDEVINHWKGVNYPIMNIYERGLCVLQCKYIHALIFSAPFQPTRSFLTSLPHGTPVSVYHGPTSFIPLSYDPYTDAKSMNIFKVIGTHDFQDINAGEIVDRIMRSRALYEERQRVKGVKGIGEEAQRRREVMEKEAEEMGRRREAEREKK